MNKNTRLRTKLWHMISRMVIIAMIVCCCNVGTLDYAKADTHTHDWEYWGDGSKIVAHCNESDCPLEEVSVGLVLTSGEDYHYNPSIAPVIIEEDRWVEADFSLPTVLFDEETYVPSVPGVYDASIEYEGETAYLSFKVAAELEITTPEVVPEVTLGSTMSGLATLSKDINYTYNTPVSVSSISCGWMVSTDGTDGVLFDGLRYKHCDNHVPAVGEKFIYVVKVLGTDLPDYISVNDEIEYLDYDYNEEAHLIKYYGGILGSDGKITGGVFDKYTVTFNANGGDGTMDSVMVKGRYELPDATFTPPAGKEFEGWAYEPDENAMMTSYITVDDDVTLYAKWYEPMGFVGMYFHYYYDEVEDPSKFYSLSLFPYDFVKATDKAGTDYELDTDKTPSLSFFISNNGSQNHFRIYYKSKSSGGPTPSPDPGPAPGPAPGPVPPEPTPEPTPDPVKDNKIESLDDPETNSIFAKAELKNQIAVIDTLTDKEINAAVKKNDSGVITIDFSQQGTKVKGTALDKQTAEKIANALKDKSNGIDSLEIKTKETSVNLDRTALEAVAESAENATDLIRLVVEDTHKKMDNLTRTQEKSIESEKLLCTFDAYIVAGNNRVHDLKGGQMTIAVDWPFDSSIEANKIKLTHMLNSGDTEELKWTMDVSKEKKRVVFKTGTLSYFAFTYVEDEETLRNNAIALNKDLKVAQDENGIAITWGTTEATGYLVYMSYCGEPLKLVKTIENTDVNSCVISAIKGVDLDRTKNYKVRVKAYRQVAGKRVIVGKSLVAHIVGDMNAKFTNPKGIKLSGKKTLSLECSSTGKIKGTVILEDSTKKQLSDKHARELRFVSTDPSIATVDKNGKVKAISQGKCTVYVYAKNGFAKQVKVLVK